MKENIKRNTLITASGMMFFQLSNFGLGVYIARFFGSVELGNYQLFVTTVTFFSLFAKIGFDEKISYQLPTLGGPRTKAGQAFTTKVINQTTTTSLALLIPYCLYVIISSNFSIGFDQGVRMLAFCLYLPAFVAVLMLTSILRADHQMVARGIFSYFLPNLLNFSCLIALGYWISDNSTLLARACSFSIISISLIIYVDRKYGFVPFRGLQFERPTEFSWLLMAVVAFSVESGLLAIKYSQMYLPETDFGVFTILLRLASLVMICPVAITVVMAPVLARDPTNRSVQKKMLLLNLLGVFLALGGIAVMARYLLATFGQEYVIYSNQLIFLSSAMATIAITQPLTSIFIAKGNRHWIYYPGLFVLMLFLSLIWLSTDRTLTATLYIFEISLVSYSVSRVLLYALIMSKESPPPT